MYQVDLYSSSNSAISEITEYILKKYGYLIKFKDNMSVLDIGTGDGRITSEMFLPLLPKNYKELILTDKSKIMLDRARKLEALSNMHFFEMEAETEKISEEFKNRFDLIFSNMALHFVNDSRQTIQNMYDMLNPGGEVFCVFLAECPQDSAWEALGKHPKWSKYYPNPWLTLYYNNPKVYDIYKQHLDDCGFTHSLVVPEQFQVEFSNENQFRDLLTSVNIAAEKIPIHLREEYTEDYFEFLRKDKSYSSIKTEDGKERIQLLVKLVVFHAKKPIS